MREIVAALRAQHEELDSMLGELAGAAWVRPSRCPGWAVADVVLHLAQTDEWAVASTEGRLAEVDHGWHAVLAEGGSVDDAATAAVAAQRGAPPAQLLTRWRAAAAAERAAFTSCAPHTRFP
ncbi:MAG: maleylpyruvate isomerase N-terminal domain-containing protein [Pseudonocardiales bacterium]|nr:maleylpyruvate isomerase N-terminal domain-containing protein [Pseudonocardiales bacterium]